MHAARSPFDKLAIALVAFCVASMAVIAYRGHQRERAAGAARVVAKRSANQAVEDTRQANARLDALIRELDAQNAQIDELTRKIDNPSTSATERERTRNELRRLKEQWFHDHPPRVLDDRLLEPVQPLGSPNVRAAT